MQIYCSGKIMHTLAWKITVAIWAEFSRTSMAEVAGPWFMMRRLWTSDFSHQVRKNLDHITSVIFHSTVCIIFSSDFFLYNSTSNSAPCIFCFYQRQKNLFGEFEFTNFWDVFLVNSARRVVIYFPIKIIIKFYCNFWPKSRWFDSIGLEPGRF